MNGKNSESNWKPDAYTSVSPYLIVSGADHTIEFLRKVFAAELLRRIPDSNDESRVMHAEVRIDDSVVMIADGGDGWPPVNANVHVYVEHVDETFRKALDAGAESIQAPLQKSDEDKRGGVKDAGGTTWWIATRVG